MANPVVYPYSSWQPDSYSADSNHPITNVDLMGEGSANDNAGWMRKVESQMRYNTSAVGQWEQWLGINTPYAPSPNAPVYVAESIFTLTGDWTSPSAGYYPEIAVVGRRVKAYTSTYPGPAGIPGSITAATVASGITTVTVLWDDSGFIDSSLSEVQFGIPAPGGSAIPIPAAAQYIYYGSTLGGPSAFTSDVATNTGQRPANYSDLTGQVVMIAFGQTNLANATINLNSLGVQTIQTPGGGPLPAEVIAPQTYTLCTWSADGFQIVAPLVLNPGGSYSTTGLSGSVSLTTSPSNLGSVTVTIPANYYTYRIQIAYGLSFTTSSTGAFAVDVEVSDGSNTWGYGSAAGYQAASASTFHYAQATDVSPVTYNLQSSVTLTLSARISGSSITAVTNSTSGGGFGFSSFLKVWCVASN